MLNTKEEIKDWLDSRLIKKYIINDNLTVDVDGNVDLSHSHLDTIPIKFNIVLGDFSCGWNKLTSLEGCPINIKGNFYCGYNKLTNLEFCPKVGINNFGCAHNNLTSLKGCPNIVRGSFFCENNNLISLQGCPEQIGDSFYCMDNPLTDIENFPNMIKNNIMVDADIWFKGKNVKNCIPFNEFIIANKLVIAEIELLNLNSKNYIEHLDNKTIKKHKI